MYRCNMQVLIRSRKGADSGYPITATCVDMWSGGVLLFTIAAKQPPFTSAEGSVRDLSKQHKAWVRLLFVELHGGSALGDCMHIC